MRVTRSELENLAQVIEFLRLFRQRAHLPSVVGGVIDQTIVSSNTMSRK